MSSEVIGRISHLAIHPVKGAAMLEVDSAIITPGGFKGDREFAVVRAAPDKDGVHNVVTQRDKRNDEEKQPQGLSVLALVKPQLNDGFLQLTWDGKDPIYVPNNNRTSKPLSVRIWSDVVNAHDQGDKLANWLSDHLQTNVRLVKAARGLIAKPFHRWSSGSYTPAQTEINFQDGYPVHWFMQESVDELAAKAGQDISWRRFRPNMVASGGEPQAEHQIWAGAIAGVNGDIHFFQPKPCDRCPVTTVDQDTGQKMGTEPLKTLATYKQWRDKDGHLKVIFGENMMPGGTGEVTIGDEIILFHKRKPALVYGAKV